MGNELGELLGLVEMKGLRLRLRLGSLETDGVADGSFGGMSFSDCEEHGFADGDSDNERTEEGETLGSMVAVGETLGFPDGVSDKEGTDNGDTLGALVAVGSVDGIPLGDPDTDELVLAQNSHTVIFTFAIPHRGLRSQAM